jgi:hypothetical protein
MPQRKRLQQDTPIPARLKRKHRLVLNEPTLERTGDKVPALARLNLKALGPTVGARLILERDLRVCGLARPGPSIRVTAAIRQVLLTMLEETDSPFSASLRMRAAALAGPLDVKKAAPRLRRIALDEDEDLATRLGAVRSYLRLAGRAPALRELLHARQWQVRALAYAEAMKAEGSTLQAIAAKELRRERNENVRLYVARRVNAVRTQDSTGSDAS